MLNGKSQQFHDVIMVGRTHLQDATPLTLGQLISGWVAQLYQALDGLGRALPGVCALAVGGTAVGTGLNAEPRFGAVAAQKIAEESVRPAKRSLNWRKKLLAHCAIGSFSSLRLTMM